MKSLAKNGILMMGAQLLTAILGFANRRLFLTFLSIEFLGYESIFSNVLSLLSVADIGMETVIVSKMYKAVVVNDTEEICKLLYIFKWFYRGVSLFVLVAAIAITPLLPLIIQDATASWNYLYVVYFMQVVAIVFGYFLSYRRALFIADQKGGICSVCDVIGKLSTQIVQLMVLMVAPNYILYLFCKLCTAPISNLMLRGICLRKYPYTKEKIRARKEDISKFDLYGESKNYLIHKICSLVFNATDTIIISIFCGIVAVAQYGNYYTLFMTVSAILITAPFNALQAAVGNHLQKYCSNDEKQKIIDAFFLMSGIFAIQIALGFSLFSQSTIVVWLGKEYLLPLSVPILFALARGLVSIDYALICYRNPIGGFYKDVRFVVASAVGNILCSIIGAYALGIEGVLIGTIIGQLIVQYGHAKVVAEKFFAATKAIDFIIKQIVFWPLLMLAETGICVFLLRGSLEEASLASLAIKAGVWCGFCGLNLLLFRKASGYELVRDFFMGIVSNKINKRSHSAEEK